MLYVFNILPGTMINFDIDIALESVLELKKQIQAKFNIPVSKQILLINGGELLDNEFKVCNYNGIGTDSTPIYLFNLYALENPLPQNQLTSQQSSPNQPQFLSSSPSSNQFPTPIISSAPSQQFILSLHSQQIHDEQQIKLMKNKVLDSLNLEASYSTIVARTEIAKQIRDLTTQQYMTCEQLIRDQHLQYQGFSAAIANLEDIETLFDTNVEKTIQIYKTFLNNKGQYIELLNKLNIDIQLLDMIPVLDVFNDNSNDEFNKETVKQENGHEQKYLDEPDCPPMISSTIQSSISKNDTTLLDWIHSKDDRFTLNNLINNCLIAMDHFNEQNFEELTQRCDNMKKNLANRENKRINKIEERFYKLDELLVTAKNAVNDTNGLTSAFIQNQNSACNVRDNLIFSELCTSHQEQLKLILQNLVNLNNIKNRYLKAKYELIMQLHSKLKNIILLESDLSSINSTLIICSENLRKLVKNLQVLEQVHRTPKVYFLSINEILRRNLFNKRFGNWSESMNKKCNEIYDKETNLRTEFKSRVSNHFLTMLFSGLNDEFPEFFFKELPKFDEQLVEISENDLNKLKQVLPRLKEFVEHLENKDYIEYVDELKINEELLNENLIFDNLCLNCFKNSQLKEDDKTSNRQTNDSTDFEKILNELDTMNSDELKNQDKYFQKQESTELAAEAVETLICENESELFMKDIDADRKQNNLKLLKQKIESKLIKQELKLRKQFDDEIERIKKEFAEQMKQELTKQESKLKTEHKLEIDSIRSRFKLACALDRSSFNSMESSTVKYPPIKTTKED